MPTTPYYRYGRAGEADTYHDLFTDAAKATDLVLDITDPLDVPPLHKNVVSAISVHRDDDHNHEDTQEELVYGNATSGNDCTDVKCYFPSAEYYRVRGAKEPVSYLKIYPRLPQSTSLTSNYTSPTNHIRTLLTICQWSEREAGTKGWNPTPFKANLAFQLANLAMPGLPDANGQAPVDCFIPDDPVRGGLRPCTDGQRTHKIATVSRVVGNTDNPSWDKLTRENFAERLGFFKAPLPLVEHLTKPPPDEPGANRQYILAERDGSLTKFHPDPYPDASVFGPRHVEAAHGAVGTELVQYQVLPFADPHKQFASAFDLLSTEGELPKYTSNPLRMHQNSTHRTCAASPYFWLSEHKWRAAGERQGIDFLPFFDPVKEDGSPHPTRPITYRFWDSVASTTLFGAQNPSFECSLAMKVSEFVKGDNENWFDHDIPDMQAYRDAIYQFGCDEGALMAFHKHLNPDASDEEVLRAAYPSSYHPVPESTTRKDVQYVPASEKRDPVFEPTTNMATRRNEHYRLFQLRNQNMVRDYRNTFTLHQAGIAKADLTHYMNNYAEDGSGQLNPDDIPFSNLDEFQRLIGLGDNPADPSAGAEIFNSAINHSSISVITRSLTANIVLMSVAELQNQLKEYRTRAITTLLHSTSAEVLKRMTEAALNSSLFSTATSLMPATTKILMDMFEKGVKTVGEDLAKMTMTLAGSGSAVSSLNPGTDAVATYASRASRGLRRNLRRLGFQSSTVQAGGTPMTMSQLSGANVDPTAVASPQTALQTPIAPVPDSAAVAGPPMTPARRMAQAFTEKYPDFDLYKYVDPADPMRNTEAGRAYTALSRSARTERYRMILNVSTPAKEVPPVRSSGAELSARWEKAVSTLRMRKDGLPFQRTWYKQFRGGLNKSDLQKVLHRLRTKDGGEVPMKEITNLSDRELFKDLAQEIKGRAGNDAEKLAQLWEDAAQNVQLSYTVGRKALEGGMAEFEAGAFRATPLPSEIETIASPSPTVELQPTRLVMDDLPGPVVVPPTAATQHADIFYRTPWDTRESYYTNLDFIKGLDDVEVRKPFYTRVADRVQVWKRDVYRKFRASPPEGTKMTASLDSEAGVRASASTVVMEQEGRGVIQILAEGITSEAVMGFLIANAPIAIVTGIIIGIQTAMDLQEKHYQDQLQEEREAALRQQNREKFKAYYNEPIPLQFVDNADVYIRQYMQKQHFTDATGKAELDVDAYGLYSMQYVVLLKKIMRNELSIHVVDDTWLAQNASQPKGRDLLTAEMIREMRVVDHYLRDVHPTIQWGPDSEGVTRPKFVGGSPFPPVENQPITYIAEAMTPLPLLNVTVLKALENSGESMMARLGEVYGPWVPLKLQLSAKVAAAPDDKTTVPCPTDTDMPAVGCGPIVFSKLPVPVYVGFLASPTGFVSSEDPSMAWPTVLHYKKGGSIPADHITSAGQTLFATRFQDGMDLGGFVALHKDVTLLQTQGYGLSFLRTDDTPGDGDMMALVNTTKQTSLSLLAFAQYKRPLGVGGDFPASLLGDYIPVGYAPTLSVAANTVTIKGSQYTLVSKAGDVYTVARPSALHPGTRFPDHVLGTWSGANGTLTVTPTTLSDGTDTWTPTAIGDGGTGHNNVWDVVDGQRVGTLTYTVIDNAYKNDYTQHPQLDFATKSGKFAASTHSYTKHTGGVPFDPHPLSDRVTLTPSRRGLTLRDKDSVYDYRKPPDDVWGLKHLRDIAAGQTADFNKADVPDNSSLVVMATSAIPPSIFETRYDALLEPNTWAQTMLRRASDSTRTAFFGYTADTWTKPVTFEVRVVAGSFECPAVAALRTKLESSRKAIEHDAGYVHLDAFFQNVESDFVPTTDEGCDFAYWLAEQFGPERVDTREVQTQMFPRSLVTQRALQFAFRWIWTKKEVELPKGRRSWDAIVTELVSLPPHEAQFVLPRDRNLWLSYSETAKVDRPPGPPKAHDPAGTRDVGYLFVAGDLDEDYDMFTIWDKGVGRENNKEFGDEMGPFSDLWKAMKNFELFRTFTALKRGWEVMLPGLNNLPEWDQTLLHHDPLFDDLMKPTDAVRRARVSIAKRIQGRVVANVVEDVVHERMGNYDPAVHPDAINPLNMPVVKMDEKDFRKEALKLVAMALAMRFLPKFQVKSHDDLMALDNEAQLFVRMSDDTYKAESERLHLEDPEHYSMFYYVKELSDYRSSVYYNPAEDGGSMLKTPCIVVAFRGTTIKLDFTQNNFFRSVTHSKDDILADVHILTGTQVDSQRFKEHNDALKKVMARYKNTYVYLTGHSLGGAIAMDNLAKEGDSDLVVKGVVFNPGVSMDPAYTSLVNETIWIEVKGKLPFLTKGQRKLVSPLLTKLVTHKIGGPTVALHDDDPVSMCSGGVGTTFHYEGINVPGSLNGHSLSNFPRGNIRGVPLRDRTVPTVPSF